MSLSQNETFYPELAELAQKDAAHLLAEIDEIALTWQHLILEKGDDHIVSQAQYVNGIRLMLRNSVHHAMQEMLGPKAHIA